MSRGRQKLLAFAIGFPLFLFSFGSFFSGLDDKEIFGPIALLGLAIWLWGVFAPIKDG